MGSRENDTDLNGSSRRRFLKQGAVPMFKPASLTPNEVYALTAFVLYTNTLIKEDDVMNWETLPNVLMPNRHGMVPDNLEDIPNIEKRGCYRTYGFCL